MANFNQFTGIGTLTRDVEIKYTPSGSAVSNVSLAINEKYTTKAGEKREDVLFLECVLWGKTAELAGQYLAKGKQVLFSGRLKQENWEDKATGQKRSKVVLNVDDMQFLGGPSGGVEGPAARQEAPQAQQRQQTAPAKQQSFYDAPAASGDDVPF
jgi:single-strand DNA-binding protein